ncbi:MAG: flavohemoglobin expression-modulating QEGLA motif protein [Acidimicrobiales bacterium]
MAGGNGDLERVRSLSDELVDLQRPIRILDAVAWGDDVAARFFAGGASTQPEIGADYYSGRRPLGFEPDELRDALGRLDRRIRNELGSMAVGALMRTRIADYLRVLDLLEARGTAAFGRISAELYGSADDVLHHDGPTLAELGELMQGALAAIAAGSWDEPEEPEFSAEASVAILTERLARVLGPGEVRVIVDDGIVADAAAGADYIKLRAGAEFSRRELRVLEVHEGWVHVATTLNGRQQPWCTFLGKGTPSTTVTQEGLAIFTEVTTLSSTPARLGTIARRIHGIAMAQDGATFLEVYRWLLDHGLDESAAWSSSVRIFRGSTPTGPPFTKDLVYGRGFMEVYDVMRLAVRRGLLDRLPLLFVGKLAVRELGVLAELESEGVVVAPPTLPPNMRDVTALASWLALSSLLNRIDLDVMETELSEALS